jgi:hypothetical protein
MFANIRNVATIIILVESASYSHAQTTVWLSNNATFADLDITTAAPPGTTGSFDIWVKTEQPNRHNSIDVHLMAMGDAIEFIGADIVIGEDRFRVQGDAMVLQGGSIVTDMFGYSGIGGLLLGTGIGPGVPVDNEALGAYRFATIHYLVTGGGVSELQLKVGNDFVFQNLDENTLHLGIDDPISQNIAGSTDTITDGRIIVVPEPGSLFLLLVGGLLPQSARSTRLA